MDKSQMKVEKWKSCTLSLLITLHLSSILITHLMKPYLFSVDVIVALQNHNDHLKEVVENASQAISIINEKHKRYLDEIEASKSNHSRELQEIKRISGVKKYPSLTHSHLGESLLHLHSRQFIHSSCFFHLT
jgi:hypothetical protein